MNTRIARRQHVVFFTDGLPNRGTFHTNFVLTPGQDNWVGVYDADGKLIDSVIVPASLGSDQTYARMTDGDESWHVRTARMKNTPTPSSANRIKGRERENRQLPAHGRKRLRHDHHGHGNRFHSPAGSLPLFYAIGKIGSAVSRMNKARALGVEPEAASEPAPNTIPARKSPPS